MAASIVARYADLGGAAEADVVMRKFSQCSSDPSPSGPSASPRGDRNSIHSASRTAAASSIAAGSSMNANSRSSVDGEKGLQERRLIRVVPASPSEIEAMRL